MSGSSPSRAPRDIDHAVVRFAGDSGDGMQLTGTEFTREAAFQGNDLATFPDYPAEIRAPAGTTAGVPATSSSSRLTRCTRRAISPTRSSP